MHTQYHGGTQVQQMQLPCTRQGCPSATFTAQKLLVAKANTYVETVPNNEKQRNSAKSREDLQGSQED